MEQENLKRAFVGDKFDKLYNKNFSIWAFLFGPFYYIYRKMVLKGFWGLLLEVFVACWLSRLNNTIIYISLFLIHLSFSLLFNSSYRNFVNKKVDRVVDKFKSEEESIKLCEKKGGTSIGLTIFFIILYIIIMIISILTLNVAFLVKDTTDFVKDTLGIESLSDRKIIIDDDGYAEINGISNDELEDYITYELNKKFKKDSVWEGKYVYEDGEGEIFNEVQFSITGSDEIEDNTSDKFETTSSTINGNKWTILEQVKNDESELIYAYANINDIYVLIIYEIDKDVEDKETARQYLDDVIESIE